MNVNTQPEVLIDWFDDFYGPQPYAFLSNFYLGAPIAWQGQKFATSEQAFAWAKVDPYSDDAAEWREQILRATDPGEAKSLGRSCPLHPRWEEQKFQVMRSVVWAKFTQNPDIALRLLDTDTAYLQEGTFWGDAIWGVILDPLVPPFEREGWNWLGLILMETRARLATAAILDEVTL